MNKTVCIAVTLDIDPEIKSKMRIVLVLKKTTVERPVCYDAVCTVCDRADGHTSDGSHR